MHADHIQSQVLTHFGIRSNYGLQTLVASAAAYARQQPVATNDDLIPSDGEVVPLEGIYQSGE